MTHGPIGPIAHRESSYGTAHQCALLVLQIVYCAQGSHPTPHPSPRPRPQPRPRPSPLLFRPRPLARSNSACRALHLVFSLTALRLV